MNTEKTFEEKYNSLSEKQQTYFDVMMVKYGILFTTSKPGQGKSAIHRDIANKMGYQFIDIRLALRDETDVGLFPTLDTISVEVDGKFQSVPEGTPNSKKVLDFVVPKWAILANSKPTIIHFDELNRSPLPVRNAALQILLEREIGSEFKFNDNVLMCASGNLGTDDGTDVEELDAALNNRLWHFEHDLPATEWLENYANENVHPSIVEFININKDELYMVNGSVNGELPAAYATPRSWDMLSKYIFYKLGDKDKEGKYDAVAVQKCVTDVGANVIGTSSIKFIKYLEDSVNFSIQHVMNNFKSYKKLIKEAGRDKSSELIFQLKKEKIYNMNQSQIKNITDFLNMVDNDEVAGFLLELLQNGEENKVVEEPTKSLFRSFRHILGHPDDDQGIFKMSIQEL